MGHSEAARQRADIQPRVDLEAARLIVILATYNGAEWIERVLAGYERQKGVLFRWALLVIDNASTDSTPAILDRFRSSLPLVVITEPDPGKNLALNRGLAAINNPVCDYVFTDDDAVPDSDFLAAWHKAFTEKEAYGLFGGIVRACFEGIDTSIPQRYAKWHSEIYACNERSEGEIPPGAIFGPNMGVSGHVLRAGFRFNEAIGPNSSDTFYPMGSETEFCVRVAREAMVRCWFTSEPRVSHIVRPNQAVEDFILARAYRHGRGCATKDGPIGISFFKAIKEWLLIAQFTIVGLLGSAEARWNAAWHRGFVAGLRENVAKGLVRRARTAEGMVPRISQL
jgi:glycosyltransferase involved in cell wall biosynthesis